MTLIAYTSLTAGEMKTNETIRLSNNRRGAQGEGGQRARARGHFLYHIHYRNKSWALAYHLRVDSGVVAKGGPSARSGDRISPCPSPSPLARPEAG